jgi:hypothetical protein
MPLCSCTITGRPFALGSRTIEHKKLEWPGSFRASYTEPYEYLAAFAMLVIAVVSVRDAIAEAARGLDRLRTGWLNPPGLSDADLAKRTLTNLYNARPTWLVQAHERLDAAVLATYGWPANLGHEELLARLLALNLARAEGR